MTALNDKARGRFVKLCGRLESPHSGEVLAAAGQLKRFLDKHQISWDDIIGMQTPTRQRPLANPRPGDLLRIQRALQNPLFLTVGEKRRLSMLGEALEDGLELSADDDQFLAAMFVRVGV